MNNNQPLLIYIFAFLIASIVLKFFGLINFNTSEIIGYALIFYGIAQVYISFGNNQKVKLFLGTSLFLAGLFLFIINNFEFFGISQLIISSIFFIISISFFMVFIDDFSDKILLILSLIFFISGLSYTFYQGSPKLVSFLSSILKISLKYLPIIIIAAGIIFLINRGKK